MAKKKPGISSDLFDSTSPESESKGKKKNDPDRKLAGYVLDIDLINRINTAAKELSVEKSALVRVLLTHALDDLENERLEIKTKPVYKPTRKIIE